MGQSNSKRERGASVQERKNTGTPANGAMGQSKSAYSRTYDHVLKLVLFGDSGTGKTLLCRRFTLGNDFSPSRDTPRHATIVFDHKTKTVSLNGLKVRLDFWDINVTERYRMMTLPYYRCATGIMVVYSATTESSFERVSNWLEEIEKKAPPGIPVILVGNMCDRVEKEVEYERARDFADERGLLHFETSAKDGTNVELAFLTLAAAALEYQMSEKSQ